MSNVTRVPPFPKTAPVEADIPVSQRDEFDQAMIGVVTGDRPRMEALERDEDAIEKRALSALKVFESALTDHSTTGCALRLVYFLAALYNGQDYPFDLTELRTLDTRLANACLDYFNYDRLGYREVHKPLANGERDLHRWIEYYDIKPVRSVP